MQSFIKGCFVVSSLLEGQKIANLCAQGFASLPQLRGSRNLSSAPLPSTLRPLMQLCIVPPSMAGNYSKARTQVPNKLKAFFHH